MNGSGSRATLRPAPYPNTAFRAGVRSASCTGRAREYALFIVKGRTVGRATLPAHEP